MKALFTGIYSRWTSNTDHAFYTGVGGRLYQSKAGRAASFPYAVVSLVSATNDWTFDFEFEELTIQINIFSQNTSPGEAGTLLASCKSLFDNCALTVTGYTHVYMQRELVVANNDIDEDPTIFGYTVQYRVLLYK